LKNLLIISSLLLGNGGGKAPDSARDIERRVAEVVAELKRNGMTFSAHDLDLAYRYITNNFSFSRRDNENLCLKEAHDRAIASGMRYTGANNKRSPVSVQF